MVRRDILCRLDPFDHRYLPTAVHHSTLVGSKEFIRILLVLYTTHDTESYNTHVNLTPMPDWGSNLELHDNVVKFNSRLCPAEVSFWGRYGLHIGLFSSGGPKGPFPVLTCMSCR